MEVILPEYPDLEEQVRLILLDFRKGRRLTQRQFSQALGWPGHLLPDLESGRVKWSLARLHEISRHFEVSPDYFLMGPEIHAEKVEFLRLLEELEPRKRRLLGQFVRELGIDDPRILADVLRMARRISPPGAHRRATSKHSPDS